MSVTPEQFAKRLRKAADELDKKRLQFHRFAAEIARDERRKGFERGESPTGEKWKPLSPATVKRKSGGHSTQKIGRKGGISGLTTKKAKASSTPEKPLIDTGAMMTPTVKASMKEGLVVMARSRAEVVSSAGSISKIHQDGAGVPKRVHWGFYRSAITRIEDTYHKLLKEIVKEMGRG